MIVREQKKIQSKKSNILIHTLKKNKKSKKNYSVKFDPNEM